MRPKTVKTNEVSMFSIHFTAEFWHRRLRADVLQPGVQDAAAEARRALQVQVPLVLLRRVRGVLQGGRGLHLQLRNPAVLGFLRCPGFPTGSLDFLLGSLGTKHESDFYDRHRTRQKNEETNVNDDGEDCFEDLKVKNLELSHPHLFKNQICKPIVIEEPSGFGWPSNCLSSRQYPHPIHTPSSSLQFCHFATPTPKMLKK